MKPFSFALLLSATLCLSYQGELLAGWNTYQEHRVAYKYLKSIDAHKRHHRKQKNRIKPPEGFNGFMTFIANGEFDPTMPHLEVPGCFQSFCSGDYYHTEIMGRTLAEVSALELEAKLYFNMRFGIDVDDPDNMGKLFFRRYYRDPRTNLNAYLVSGKSVPTSGWHIDDGGWAILFLQDVTLGGDHTGEIMPAGASLEWGEFVIQPTSRTRTRAPIIISYRSAIPTLNRRLADANTVGFQYELFKAAADAPGNDWGNSEFPHQGLDEGFELFTISAGGNVKANARHILTFSTDDGL